MYSCSGEDDVFSCDPEANEWAKENLDDIRQMTRADWLNVSENLQRAAYVAFTPEQKQSLWVGKLNEILRNVVWTPQEKTHIEYILSLISENSSLFDKNTNKEDLDKIEIELYKWKEYAIEELGWTPMFLSSITTTPHFMNAERQIVVNETLVSRLKSGGETECDCNSSSPSEGSSSGNWLCNHVFNRCKTDSGCTKTSWGCGDFWYSGCDGTCVSRS
jgi:hypothetical protein